MSVLQKCGQVLGVELLAQAVDDAKSNAEDNDITNCDFFVGRAEDILSSVMNRAVKEDILAVVDPPRAGLRKDFILLNIFSSVYYYLHMPFLSEFIHYNRSPILKFHNCLSFQSSSFIFSPHHHMNSFSLHLWFLLYTICQLLSGSGPFGCYVLPFFLCVHSITVLLVITVTIINRYVHRNGCISNSRVALC